MAKSAPAASTKPASAPANVAGNDPDMFVQGGGLPSDFEGTCVEARVCPWDYNGKVQPPILGVRVTVRPDPGQEEIVGEGSPDVVAYYSAGDLGAFVPSMDGENPSVDADNYYATNDNGVQVLNPEADGIYFLKVGAKAGISNQSNWAQAVGAMLDAEFPRAKLTPAVTFIEGVHGKWARVPQIKRSGIVGADPNKKNDILVLTAITPAPATAATRPAPATVAPGAKPATRPTAATTPTPAAPAATGGALDNDLNELVIAHLRAVGGSAKKSALAGYVVKNATGLTKTKGVKRVTEIDFLSRWNEEGEATPRWFYDADAGELTLIDSE